MKKSHVFLCDIYGKSVLQTGNKDKHSKHLKKQAEYFSVLIHSVYLTLRM